MTTVKLQNGFEAKVDPDKLNDMYFVEALAQLETNILVLPRVCNMLLGEAQKTELFKSLEDENGRVPLEAVNDAISEIMEKAGAETKNS